MMGFLTSFRQKWRERAPLVPLRRRIDFGIARPAYAIYAVGDIHGSIDLLQHAEDRIQDDIARTGVAGLVIYLGDYVDRGPNSAAVLDHLLRPAPRKIKRLPLCGNHDDMFLRFLQSPKRHRRWLDMGGRQTLLSYGLDSLNPAIDGGLASPEFRSRLHMIVPPAHIEFLESLPVCARIGEYVFVHAGIRPGRPLEAQTDNDMMWIREPFLSSGPGVSNIVVHGHTPAKSPTTGPNRIGIDTGAYITGKLSILRLLDGRQSFF